jgi:hypothetical protein
VRTFHPGWLVGGGKLEGVQDFDGRRILFLLDAAVYLPRLPYNRHVGVHGTSSKQGAVGTLNPLRPSFV